MKHIYLTTFIIIAFLLTSCFETNTNNPRKAYQYWTGINPENNIEVLDGQYWESAHWSHEYIVYLKIKVTEGWWQSLIEDKKLIKDTCDTPPPNKAPDWFAPTKGSAIYQQNDKYFNQGSLYYFDSLTFISYIYEIRL